MSSPNDQAASLRKSAASRMDYAKSLVCYAVASGKGGVGKTFLTVNLAVAMAEAGKKVLLVDADLGLANADILLGVNPPRSLQDAIFKGVPLDEVVSPTPFGVDLVSASSGAKEMVSMGEARLALLVSEILSYASKYDAVLFDCAAGIDGNVMAFMENAPKGIIVATPQPTSIMDAYALLKVLHQGNPARHISFVVNMIENDAEADRVKSVLQRVSGSFLSRPVEILAAIPNSKSAIPALRNRKPLVAFAPDDAASKRIRELAEKLLRGAA